MTVTHHSIGSHDRAAMAELRSLLASGPAFELVPGARAIFDQLMGQIPHAEAVAYEHSTVAGIPGGWCRPAGTQRSASMPWGYVVGTVPGIGQPSTHPQRRAAMLYLHGGGYVLGSAKAYLPFVGQIAARAAVDAFVPDYRLAPEHVFPAALDDVLAAYEGLVAMGYHRIALVGDSAGGGLALSALSQLCQMARSTDMPAPVCAAVVSPWTDLSLAGHSMQTRAPCDPQLNRATLSKAARLYLGNGPVDPQGPRVSSLFAPLHGLPPVRLHVGADEVLLDDSVRYAHALQAAGGTVELHVWEGMTHVFPANLQRLDAARDALDDMGSFLAHRLAASYCAAAPT